MNRILLNRIFPLFVVIVCNAQAFAIGPNAARTPIPWPGWDGGIATVVAPAVAADPFPFVPKIRGDIEGNGRFVDLCTGTLIAPRVVATAAHCFVDRPFVVGSTPEGAPILLQPGQALPANRVLVEFGDVPFVTGPLGNVGLGGFLNAGGLTHPNYNSAAPVPAVNDIAYVTLSAMPNVTPVPILPRLPIANRDLNTRIGYGQDAGFQRPPGLKKAWGMSNIDSITAHHIGQNLPPPAGQVHQEHGDSGGPNLYRFSDQPMAFRPPPLRVGALPIGSVYLPNWDARGRDAFVFGAVHGRAGGVGHTVRFDERGDPNDNLVFLSGGMPNPVATNIIHNLSDDPCSLAPATPQAVVISAIYPAGSDYVFYPKLWEEDNQLAAPFYFDGDMRLGRTPFADDLAGLGYTAGRLPGGLTTVHAFDIRTAGALCKLDEALNPLDPPLDWLMKLYPTGDTFHLTSAAMAFPGTTKIAPSTNQQVLDALNDAIDEILNGQAVHGPFALFPEPGTLTLLAFGAATILLRRRTA